MPPYADPRSLKQSLNSRFRSLASEQPGRSAHELQRQFAYDRLLARIFSAPDADLWVLKGSTALLARLSGTGRHTLDVDLYRQGANDALAAELALRRAAEIDLHDFFRFSLGPAQTVANARRIRVEALLGVTLFDRFPVDLVTGLSMTSSPELVDPPLPEIPGIVRVSYRAYPLADHIADKVCALHEVHERVEGPAVPSTRYRDLADLVVIARTSKVDAVSVIAAVRSEESRRGLTLPRALVVPSDSAWERGYSAIARKVPGMVDVDLESAGQIVGALINPVLAATARGTWDPATMSWH